MERYQGNRNTSGWCFAFAPAQERDRVMKILMPVLVMLGTFGFFIEAGVILIGLVTLLVAKSRTRRLLTAGLITLVISGAAFGVGYYDTFVNIQNLPADTHLLESQSPSGTYALEVYLVEPTLTVGEPAIRGEVHHNGTHMKNKTIYWNEGHGNPTITWIDDQTVSINGHVINVLTDTYDFRHNPWF